MPSLFSFPTALSRRPSKFLRRTAEGIPSEREINSYSVVKTALTKMIDEQGKIFRIPKEMSRELSHCAQWDLDCDLRIATKNGILEFPDQMHRYFRKEYTQLIKGHLDNWKGWNLRRIFPDGTHIFSKSPSDGIPLPLFLIRIKIPNIPINMVLHSILYNRHLFEQNLEECQRIGTSGHNFDLIKVSYRTVEESVKKTAYLARRWSYAETRGTESFCCLVERSVVPRNARRIAPRVNFLKSAFLISSMPGDDSAILSYCCRVDLRGRPKHWYDKVHAETLVQNLYRLRESLSKPLYNDIPPTM
ncbi:rho GTPase-activating protein 7 [Ditylenchus destructor]|uniref:Rho GTPase-activating protein 7 n=1 Tax=Ditylenchus destructor TaxID=166010 RepID=A0AAD4R8W1_9BILA|nr:rho GTPase-activating protein 7 [Ditylenchus destructor]